MATKLIKIVKASDVVEPRSSSTVGQVADAKHTFNQIDKKVDKVEGKQLSDENYTSDEKTKLASLQNYDDTSISNRIKDIEDIIPSAANPENNELADKDYVNNSIQTYTAYFNGNWATYEDIPTTVDGFTNEGLPEPGPNNYLVVVKDELHENSTWRYKYIGDFVDEYSKDLWQPEYKLNDTAFTDEQLNAINSGANKTKIDKIEKNESDIKSLNDWKSSTKVTLGAHTSSGADSVSIGNYAKTNRSNSVAIGKSSNVQNGSNSIAIGNSAQTNTESSIAIGSNAKVNAVGACQLGYSSTENTEEKSLRFRDTTIVNKDGKIPSANLDKSFVESETDPVFTEWRTKSQRISIGDGAVVNVTKRSSIAIGHLANATSDCSIAIGGTAKANASDSCQLGRGTNTEKQSLKFRDTEIVNTSGSKTSINRYYLNNNKFYITRSGSGTEESPYVYSDEVVLRNDVIYQDISNNKIYISDGTNIIELVPEPKEESDPVFKQWKNNQTLNLGQKSKGAGNFYVAIGTNADTGSGNNNIAIGYTAKVINGAYAAIQLGTGENSESKSLQFRSTKIVNSNGKIPSANLDITPENTSNKTTSLSEESTDTQYPSAKCVFDFFKKSLNGKSYDFSTIQGVKSALSDIVELLGGTVTNE